MTLRLPPGKRLAVALAADFDAQSLWMTAGLTSPAYLSRGEFGALVGLPRVLDLLRDRGIRATFCTPGHSLVTFPDQIDSILADGHEIAAHGAYHEQIPSLAPARERELMEHQLEQHLRIVGRRPRGYRSPSWDFSEATLTILEDFGFDWDSSLMGHDFQPYHPRPVTIDFELGNTFGPPSSILEIPVSWYLDDFPFVEFAPSLGLTSATSALDLQDRWLTAFRFALDRVPDGVYALTVHPQTIGRAHHMIMFERLIDEIQQHDDVWFASLSEVYDCWEEEHGQN